MKKLSDFINEFNEDPTYGLSKMTYNKLLAAGNKINRNKINNLVDNKLKHEKEFAHLTVDETYKLAKLLLSPDINTTQIMIVRNYFKNLSNSRPKHKYADVLAHF